MFMIYQIGMLCKHFKGKGLEDKKIYEITKIVTPSTTKRISNKLGLSKNSEPEKIEKDLVKIIPKQYFYDMNHLLMWHGRNTCIARNPKCESCVIAELCKYKNRSVENGKTDKQFFRIYEK